MHYGLIYVKIKDGTYYAHDPYDKYKVKVTTNVISEPDLFEVVVSNGE